MSPAGLDPASEAPAAVLLRCVDVSVSRGGREVVHHVSFTLAEGEVVALLGPNGAGKSTLLDALGGALVPTSGLIERHGRVAVALQSPDLASRSVIANITAALTWWGVPRSERRERATAALAAIGAGHLADRPARALSGGERRRVHLARALAVQADLLMLDEPFAGLDARIRGELLADTGAALRRGARAALVVVHDRAEAWALADRLLVLLDGEIVADGPPQDLLTDPPTAEVARFLGFDGELRGVNGERMLTRPQHVILDPEGPLRARVQTLIPVEDGVKLVLALDGGRLTAMAPLPSPRPGDTVAVRLAGGVRFPADGPRQPVLEVEVEVDPPPPAEPTVPPAAAQPPMP